METREPSRPAVKPPCGGPSIPSETANPILADPFARAFAGFPTTRRRWTPTTPARRRVCRAFGRRTRSATGTPRTNSPRRAGAAWASRSSSAPASTPSPTAGPTCCARSTCARWTTPPVRHGNGRGWRNWGSTPGLGRIGRGCFDTGTRAVPSCPGKYIPCSGKVFESSAERYRVVTRCASRQPYSHPI